MRTGWRCPSLALALFAVVACGDKSGDTNQPASDTPVQGGTVVIAIPGDFDNLNPLVSAERFTQEVNRDMLFLPLIRYTKSLDYEPALARSWKMLGDTGIVMYLRNDVKWHDGKPTTAADVIFTYDRMKDPATTFPNADYFTSWKSGKQIDSLTVQFTWSKHAEPLAGLPFLPIAPKHLLESVPAGGMREAPFNLAPVGNGPFRYVEHRNNDRWVFEANADFPKDLGGRPYLDRVIWRIVPDASAQVTEIVTGGVDVVMSPKADQMKTLSANPELRGLVRPGRQYVSIIWNGRKKPLDNPAVRRALTMAIDRQTILTTLRGGYGDLATGPIGPYHWAYDSTAKPLPFNPDSARALLKSVGIFDRNNDKIAETADGKPFRIELMFPASNEFNRNVSEVLTSNLAAVGVQLVPRPTEAATMYGTIGDPARKFEAVLIGWESDFKITLRDVYHSGAMAGPFQVASYSNPRVDALIDSVGLVTDRTEAKKMFVELQRTLQQDQPWSYLYNFPDLVVMRQRLHGVEMDIRGALLNIGKWWVTPSGGAAGQGDSAAPSPAPDTARSR